MGNIKRILCSLALGTVVCLSGCNVDTEVDRETLKVIKEVLEEGVITGVVQIEDTVYDYNFSTGEKSNGRLASSCDTRAAIEIKPKDGPYSLSYVRPITYDCTKKDVCSYIYRLKDIGYTITKYRTTPECYDAILEGEGYEVRIIYTGANTVRLLARTGGTACTPPHLIGG